MHLRDTYTPTVFGKVLITYREVEKQMLEFFFKKDSKAKAPYSDLSIKCRVVIHLCIGVVIIFG